MRSPVKAVWILAILALGAAGTLAKTGAEPASDHGSIVIVFKDGHRQTLLVADVARIEFKTPVMIVMGDSLRTRIHCASIATAMATMNTAVPK